MAAIQETSVNPVLNKRRERIFFTAMSVALLLTVFAGFSRTFYLRPLFHPEPLIPLLIMHGVLFSAWLGLFITQTTLVATKRTRTHMRLGIAGGVLARLMVIVGTLTAIIRAKSFEPPPSCASPLIFLPIPLGDILAVSIPVRLAF